MQHFKITVGIPTYVGGPSLVKTVESLMQSEYREFRLIVSVDGKKLDPEIKQAVTRDARVEVIENEVRRGQVGGIRQILSLSSDQDIVILTQDDLLFDPKMLGRMIAAFEKDPKLTLVTAEARPMAPTTFFERIVHAGFFLVQKIERSWNRGDNFLNASGRCIAFHKPMTTRVFEEIQEEVINCDAHFYFINRKYGGGFRRVHDAFYYFRSPKSLAEHLKQSKKYQNVEAELLKYRRIDVIREYAIPKAEKIKAAMKSLVERPLLTPLYFTVLFYTRFHGDQTFKKATRFWDTDESTKQI